MSDIAIKRYDIYFSGETLDGHDPESVRAAVGKLFKADAKTLDRLFSGSRQRIKKACDQATAAAFQKALVNAGARIDVRLVASDPKTLAEPIAPTTLATTSAPDAEAASAAPVESPATAKLDLAPVGADVLKPEERVQHSPPDMDLGHLSVGEVGERLAPQASIESPSVNPPDFEVAEVGSDLFDAPARTAPTVPDVSSITLADADHDLSDCSTRGLEATEIDVDHLQVADAGGGLISDAERQRSTAQAPDTSHIVLDPSED